MSRLVQVLLAHLSAWDRAERTDLLRLHVAGFTRGRGAVLVPSSLRLRVESRLAAQGFRSVDGPWVVVDPRTGEVVVDEPALALDASALGALTDRWPRSPHEHLAADVGRYVVRLWALSDAAADGPSSPGLDLLNAAKALVGVDRFDAARTLKAIALLLESTPVVPAYPIDELMVGAREVAGPRNELK